MLVLLIAIILTACGTTSQSPEGFSKMVDPRLSGDVNRFFSDCKKYLPEAICHPNIELDVYVKEQAKMHDDSIGTCWTYSISNKRRVFISDQVINTSEQRLVIYHELFHCVTETEHIENEPDIMNPDTSYSFIVLQDWDSYVAKAFLRERR